MKEIKNILIPVDASDITPKVLDYAMETAKKFDAKVTLLHVYELPVPLGGFEPDFEVRNNFETEIKASVRRILDNAGQIFAESGLNFEKLMLTGHSGFRITETAEKNDFDLIIMGSRGFGYSGNLLLGSTSNYVLHHTKIPVFLIQ